MRFDKVVIMGYPRSGTTWLNKVVKLLGVEHTGVHYLTDQTEPLVFILRNYKECIIRANMTTYKGLIKGNDNAQYMGSIENYIDNIKAYHSYPGKKIILYYEDFITDPKEIDRLAEFLGVESRDLSHEQQQSIEGYAYTSISKGELIYHSKNLTDKEIETLDNRMRIEPVHNYTLRYER